LSAVFSIVAIIDSSRLAIIMKLRSILSITISVLILFCSCIFSHLANVSPKKGTQRIGPSNVYSPFT